MLNKKRFYSTEDTGSVELHPPRQVVEVYTLHFTAYPGAPRSFHDPGADASWEPDRIEVTVGEHKWTVSDALYFALLIEYAEQFDEKVQEWMQYEQQEREINAAEHHYDLLKEEGLLERREYAL